MTTATPQQEGRIKIWVKENWMGALFVILCALTFTWLVLAVISHPSKAEVDAALGKQHADTMKEMKEYVAGSMDAERKTMIKDYGLKLGGHQVVAQQQPIVLSCQSACPAPAAAPKRVAAITPVALQPQPQPQVQQPRKADVVTNDHWGWINPYSSEQNPMTCYTDRPVQSVKKHVNCSLVKTQLRNPGEDLTTWLDRAGEKEGIRGQSKVLGRM